MCSHSWGWIVGPSLKGYGQWKPIEYFLYFFYYAFLTQNWVLEHFTEKSFLLKFLTGRPFDRNTIWPNTVWPNAIWPKVHLTEKSFGRKQNLSKGRLTENIWKIVIWPKVQMTESFFRKIIWPKGHLTESSLERMFFTCHIWNMREVLVSWWEKWKKFIADFHVLGLFMAKKHYLSDKKFPSVTRRCRCRWTQNLCHAYSLDHKT
jgi:hypothetical protein